MSFKTSASCPRKAKARFDTIINTYRELFHDKLPEEKQYWTLAGPCFDENGKLGTCSEIHQLISSGLITESQYHGIDNGIEIIEKNRIAAPNSNFYHGDFISQLQIASRNNFNPGIIHADYTKLKETSVVDTLRHFQELRSRRAKITTETRRSPGKAWKGGDGRRGVVWLEARSRGRRSSGFCFLSGNSFPLW